MDLQYIVGIIIFIICICFGCLVILAQFLSERLAKKNKKLSHIIKWFLEIPLILILFICFIVFFTFLFSHSFRSDLSKWDFFIILNIFNLFN